MIEFRYRADIDGLRAVAVLLVVLFHAGLAWPGGFVGVDVFFVISGFIITGLVLKEQHCKDFSLSQFWIRRIRRILPASLFVVAATLVAGYFILLPSDFTALASSAKAQQLMWSNIHFSQNTDYFDGSTDLMPLLHTWSLAVEEQFYVIYPFVLMLLGRFSRKALIASLSALAAFSFLASAWGIHNDSPATFYLLHTRAWELLLGGILCFAPQPTHWNRHIAGGLSLLGIGGIALAAWRFDSSTPFPGAAALLPCLSTALLIYANSHSTWVGTLLSAKPVVYIGRISYSLYLWHWPLLSFLNYWHCGAKPDALSRIVAVVLSFVLAAISQRFIERPFRERTMLPQPKRLVFASMGCACALLGFSTFVTRSDGLPQRFAPRVHAYASAKDSKAYTIRVSANQVRDRTLPTFGASDGARTCLVWGDSHAMALVPGIDAACKAHHVKGYQATYSSTAPVLDFYYPLRNGKGLGSRAPEFNRAVVDFAIASKVDVVIIAARWHSCANYADFEPNFDKTIRELIDAGVNVALVRNIAEFRGVPSIKNGLEVPMFLAMSASRGDDVRRIGIPEEEYLAHARPGDAILNRVAAMSSRVTILNPAPHFVDQTRLWRAEFDGIAMYRDWHHLSVAGGERLQPLFEELFQTLGRGNSAAGRHMEIGVRRPAETNRMVTRETGTGQFH